MLTWRMRKSSNMALFIVLSVLLFTGGPAGAACLVDPTSFWQLEEDASLPDDFADSVGNSTGVCGNACPTLNGSGRVGSAQSFDNSNTQEIDIAGSSSFDWAVDASFTIEFWIMAPDGDVGGNQVVVGRDDNGADLHWWAGIYNGGITDVAAFIAIPNTAGPTTAPSLIGVTDITDGIWHHVVAVRDAQNLKNYLYVDGVLEGAECITLAGDYQTTAPVNLGYLNNNGTPGFHYQGLLDEVAIYSEALSPAVIAAHYQNGSLGNTYCSAIVPSITTTDLPDAIIGFPYTADIEAIGNPAPTFAFGGDEPQGMTFSDANNGIIDWQPIDIQAGSNVFTVTATAGVDSDSEDLAITVKDVCDDLMTSFWALEEDASAFNDGDRFENSAAADTHGYCGTSNSIPALQTADCPTVNNDGRVANGQSFDGSDDAILINKRGPVNWAYDDSFTIAVWIKSALDEDTTENDVFVGRDKNDIDDTKDNEDLHWWVGIEDSNDAAAFALFPNNGDDTAAPSLVGTTDISDNQWHYIVAVRDAVNGKNLLYVDGVLEGSECEDVVDGQDFASEGYMTLGYMNFNGDDRFHFQGILDEVAVFNTALPAAVIAQQFADGELSRGYCKTAPVITGQVLVTIDEDTPREIVLTDLIVTDADSTFPDDFTLMVQDGDNYTYTENTITPDLNFNGPLSVNVQVQDGGYISNTYALGITVTAVEDAPPVVSDIPDQTIAKGGAFTAITLDDYVADEQDDDSAIVWTATGNVLLTVTITDRVVTVSAPDAEWTGTETVTFRATNTNDLFAEDAVVFTVNDESPVEPADGGGGGGGGGSCFISTTGFNLFR